MAIVAMGRDVLELFVGAAGSPRTRRGRMGPAAGGLSASRHVSRGTLIAVASTPVLLLASRVRLDCASAHYIVIETQRALSFLD
jgi:hypothetical protein